MSGSLHLTAGSTHRARLEDTQDAAAVLAAAGGTAAVLVADGLGSFAHAGDAARFVAEEAGRLLPQISCAGELSGLFPELQRRLHAHAAPTVAACGLDPAASFGTTLLLAVDAQDALGVAYLGNGAVFHLPGDFARSEGKAALPWSCHNLLRPHSVPKDGVEALTRYLDATGETEHVRPTILWIGKDAAAGDVLLLCTDGIYSSDQAPIGTTPDGKAWQEVPRPLTTVFRALRDAFADSAPLTADRLRVALQAALDGMRARGELDDDATVGLLVTGAAVDGHAAYVAAHGSATGEAVKEVLASWRQAR